MIAPDGTIRAQYGSDRASGFGRVERVGRHIFEFAHADDHPQAHAWLARLAAAPSGVAIADTELRQRHADGSWRTVQVHGTNLLGDPAIAGLLIEEHDESERRMAQLSAEHMRDRLHLAAEGMRMGFFDYDVAHNRFELSNECYRMRGLQAPPARRVLGREVLNEIHPEDREPARAELERVLKGPADDWDAEYRLPTAGGDWMWIQQRAHVLERDAAGRATRIAGVLLDVDRRKRAERGLIQSEARYRTTIAMTPGFIHESVRTEDGRMLMQWASEGFTRLLGWTVAELNERGGWASIVHPEHREAAAGRKALVFGGEPARGETRLLAKSGDWFWFDVSLFPLQEPESGRVQSSMGTLYDITARKHAEELLRASEERFRLAAAAVDGVIYERDVATGMISCSSGISEMFGLGSEALLQSIDWWAARVHPDDLERFNVSTLASPGGRAITTEYRLRHALGHYVDILDRSVVLKDQHGVAVRVVGCAIDISGVRRAERLLGEAEALAHVGSWQYDVASGELTFSAEGYRVGGIAADGAPRDLEALFGFVAPDSTPALRARDRARARDRRGLQPRRRDPAQRRRAELDPHERARRAGRGSRGAAVRRVPGHRRAQARRAAPAGAGRLAAARDGRGPARGVALEPARRPPDRRVPQRGLRSRHPLRRDAGAGPRDDRARGPCPRARGARRDHRHGRAGRVRARRDRRRRRAGAGYARG